MFVPYVFSLVFALMSRNKGNFLFRLPQPHYQAVFAILKAVLMLFRLCFSENVSQSVAEIHGADFLVFGGTYLCLVPLPVVSHTASYCEVLFVKVDVLPSQTTHFSDTKPCVIGYLHREQCGIVFLSHPYHILHRVKGNQFLREYRKSEPAENNLRYPLLSAFDVVPSGFCPPKVRKSINACKCSAVTVFSFPRESRTYGSVRG